MDTNDISRGTPSTSPRMALIHELFSHLVWYSSGGKRLPSHPTDEQIQAFVDQHSSEDVLDMIGPEDVD